MSFAPPPPPYPRAASPYREWDHGPTGVGGWIILLLVQNIWGVLYLAFRSFHAHEMRTVLLNLLTITCHALILVCIALRSRLAVVALWARLSIQLLVTAFNVHLAWRLLHLSSKMQPRASTILLQQAEAVGFCVCWLLYWYRSRRVRNTFGEP